MNALIILLLILGGGALISYFAFLSKHILGQAVVWLIAIISPVYFFTRIHVGEIFSLNLGGYELSLGFNHYSWVFALLIMVLSPLALIYSTGYMKSRLRLGTFYFSFIFTIFGMMGILMSRDLISLFIFWEIMTWASYLLVIYRGKDVEHTGIKYMIFSAIGAYSMFMAIVILNRDIHSFDLSSIIQNFSSISVADQWLTGILLLIGFALKSAVMPLHVWAPGAYTNTPTSFTALFSGGLSKMGVYGIGLVLLNLYSHGIFSKVGIYLAWLGAITAVMATFRAVFEDDAKKLLAHSSVAQLGYIVTGMGLGTELSVFAGIYLAILHGAFKGTLFMAVGAVERQAGTTDMTKISGLIRNMPWTFFAALVAIIALAGIPPVGGFVGKWMLYEATINSQHLFLVILIFLSSTAAFLYSFRFMFGLFLGQQEEETAHIKEAPAVMIIPMILLTLFLVLMGSYPGIIFKPIAAGMAELGFEGVPWHMSVLYNMWGDSVNLVYVSVTFGLVFLLGLIYITFIARKGTKHKLSTKDIHTAGEIPKPEDNLHYALDFYKPFERVLSPLLKHKLDVYYNEFGNGLEALFNFIRRVYTGNGQTYALYVIIFLVALILFSGKIFGM